MKILAIESSTSIAGVAVTHNRILLGEAYLNHGKTHSTKLMPMVKNLLSDLDLNIGDVDLFAVNVGPGSFTGLRIGITTANSLGFALNKPVYGIYSTDILARSIPCENCLICPIIDARNNQVYCAIYERTGGKLRRLTDFMAMDLDELLEKLKKYSLPVYLPGDGSDGRTDSFSQVLGERLRIVPEFLKYHRASIMADIAFEKYSCGYDSPFANPFYLRKSQAERLFNEKGK